MQVQSRVYAHRLQGEAGQQKYRSEFERLLRLCRSHKSHTCRWKLTGGAAAFRRSLMSMSRCMRATRGARVEAVPYLRAAELLPSTLLHEVNLDSSVYFPVWEVFRQSAPVAQARGSCVGKRRIWLCYDQSQSSGRCDNYLGFLGGAPWQGSIPE